MFVIHGGRTRLHLCETEQVIQEHVCFVCGGGGVIYAPERQLWSGLTRLEISLRRKTERSGAERTREEAKGCCYIFWQINKSKQGAFTGVSGRKKITARRRESTAAFLLLCQTVSSVSLSSINTCSGMTYVGFIKICYSFCPRLELRLRRGSIYPGSQFTTHLLKADYKKIHLNTTIQTFQSVKQFSI